MSALLSPAIVVGFVHRGRMAAANTDSAFRKNAKPVPAGYVLQIRPLALMCIVVQSANLE